MVKIRESIDTPTIRVFIVMSNHLQGILIITGNFVGATRPSNEAILTDQVNNFFNQPNNLGGLPLRPHGPPRGSLGAIIGQIKSRATKRIWELPDINKKHVWQRNYYEHIIRNNNSMQDIFRYIIGNPVNWCKDEYYSII